MQPSTNKAKNLGLSYKVGMQCFIYKACQLGCLMCNTLKFTVHYEINVDNILKLCINCCSDDITEEYSIGVVEKT